MSIRVEDGGGRATVGKPWLEAMSGQGRRKRGLLVLDLNGLLLDSFDRADEKPKEAGVAVAIKVGRKRVYGRPGVSEFLFFCFQHFDVGVWSCARMENVRLYVDAIFPQDLVNQLVFVWGQDRCTYTGQGVPGQRRKPLFLKELRKLWEAFPRYGMHDTLMMDDTPYKSLRNPPYCAVFPEAYSALDHDEDGEYLRRKVVPWLQMLVGYGDTVQSFVFHHPFGQPAISSDHADWDLFRSVIHEDKPAPETASVEWEFSKMRQPEMQPVAWQNGQYVHQPPVPLMAALQQPLSERLRNTPQYSLEQGERAFAEQRHMEFLPRIPPGYRGGLDQQYRDVSSSQFLTQGASTWEDSQSRRDRDRYRLG